MTVTTLNCPQCQTTIEWSNDFPHRPFCSHRCQLMDLGEWASEGYRIPDTASEGTHPTEDENAAEG